MGKYKNDFIVEGSASLINAFAQELDILGGFTVDPTIGDGTAIEVFGWNGYDTAPSVYRKASKGVHAWSKDNKRFQFPKQWDEALLFAAELPVVEPKYKVGDWLNWNNLYKEEDKQLYRIKYLSDYNITIDYWSTDTGKYGAVSYSLSHVKHHMKLATQSQIEDHLKVIADFLFPEDSHFTSVRDYNKKEVNRHTLASSESAKSGRRGSSLSYIKENDTLYSLGFGVHVIYEKGVWATKKNNFPVIEGYIGEDSGALLNYGCKSFGKKDVIALVNQIAVFNKNHTSKLTSIEIDGIKVLLKDLEQISKEISSSK